MIVGIVAGLLFIGGAMYAGLKTLEQQNAEKNKPAPAKNVKSTLDTKVVQENLKTANDTDALQQDAHNKAQAAIDEKQVKLVK